MTNNRLRHAMIAVLSLVAALIASRAAAEDFPTFKSPEARAAVGKYQESIQKLDEQFTAARQRMIDTYIAQMKDIRQGFVNVLDDARSGATQADDLDEALKLRSAMDSLSASAIVPPDTGSDSTQNAAREIKSLQVEVNRLKTALAEKAAVTKSKLAKELAAALCNTRWESQKGDVMGLRADGSAFNWDGAPGKWTVTPDGTVMIQWREGNWMFHPNAALTMATIVNAEDNGVRVRRVAHDRQHR